MRWRIYYFLDLRRPIRTQCRSLSSSHQPVQYYRKQAGYSKGKPSKPRRRGWYGAVAFGVCTVAYYIYKRRNLVEPNWCLRLKEPNVLIPECRACGQFIDFRKKDDFVVLFGVNLHQSCLKCSICSAQQKNNHVLKKNSIFLCYDQHAFVSKENWRKQLVCKKHYVEKCCHRKCNVCGKRFWNPKNATIHPSGEAFCVAHARKVSNSKLCFCCQRSEMFTNACPVEYLNPMSQAICKLCKDTEGIVCTEAQLSLYCDVILGVLRRFGINLYQYPFELELRMQHSFETYAAPHSDHPFYEGVTIKRFDLLGFVRNCEIYVSFLCKRISFVLRFDGVYRYHTLSWYYRMSVCTHTYTLQRLTTYQRMWRKIYAN